MRALRFAVVFLVGGCSSINLSLEPVITTVDCTQEYTQPVNPKVVEIQLSLEQVRIACRHSGSYGCMYPPRDPDGIYLIYYTTPGVLAHERLHVTCGPLHKGERN